MGPPTWRVVLAGLVLALCVHLPSIRSDGLTQDDLQQVARLERHVRVAAMPASRSRYFDLYDFERGQEANQRQIIAGNLPWQLCFIAGPPTLKRRLRLPAEPGVLVLERRR